ncbi:hypothetical protein F5B18DRAFT_279355 [Nemania serpens]|nr:hypothetical protein F5B18DRAFT_279355 [Nemania serpens]
MSAVPHTISICLLLSATTFVAPQVILVASITGKFLHFQDLPLRFRLVMNTIRGCPPRTQVGQGRSHRTILGPFRVGYAIIELGLGRYSLLALVVDAGATYQSSNCFVTLEHLCLSPGFDT